MTKNKIILAVVIVVCAAAAILLLRESSGSKTADPYARLQALIADPGTTPDSEPFLAVMKDSLASYRKIIVLFADEKVLRPEEVEPVNRIGRVIYYENHERTRLLNQALATVASSGHKARFPVIEEVLNWLESANTLYDADRLAFRESLRVLQQAVSQDQSLPAVKLHRRISEDLAALDEIESLYDKELKQVFARFTGRGIVIQRQRWDDYVAKLKQIESRDRILKDYGTIVPYPQKAVSADESKEISGRGLPPMTLLLTFDDGPHRTYTGEISAILKQYRVPGVFFELGQNLGSIGPGGTPKPGRLADIGRKLIRDGFTLGNHSFSHANFSKQTEEALKEEIVRTNALLGAIHGEKSNLFRFPYGARTEAGLATLTALNLRSMNWNIDSLDWADPVPNSIVARVLRTIDAEQRGILLFHDINDRTVKALPGILDRLIVDGYRFASWDGTGFKVGDAILPPMAKSASTTGYRTSWAVVIGIDDYRKWPKLQYAVRDSEAVRKELIGKLGFSDNCVFMLKNQEATRAAILDLLNRKLGQNSVQRDDRVFVFFAGHGTTRKLTSGRDLGYIVPVDSDPENVAADAIPMTELQNIAEEIPAKHVLFVMDSCYSGLGLMRGGASRNFLRENGRRIGRQMLTAGGSDQMVSDGGPGGHSIFTYTLLQAFAGKGDLNGDGYITATELAAYLAPAVSSVSRQTPAFGSLPGSEGGEFIFELPSDNEVLSAETKQMGSAALALNQRMEAKLESGKPGAPVVVKTLDGGESKLTTAKAVPLAPRHAAQRANDRGLQHFREKRYEAAEREFTEALKLRPDFALAANNLGFIYYKRERFAEAARWFEKAISMDPSRSIAYCNLGDAYRKAGDKEKSRKAFATYLELAPNATNSAYAREMLKQL